MKKMKNTLIIHCIGKNDKIGIIYNGNFFKKHLNSIKHFENLSSIILSLLNKNNIKIDDKFMVLVNKGPGSYSAIRISLSVAKGIKLAKKIALFSYKNEDLSAFTKEKIELMVEKKLIENKLLKPIYL
tara:strand:- start:1749 stop:2132 length:384 start_codon:yes stop_codon:yes gene_type:complete